MNPSQQARLADLFASFADRDRNLIIETHSEHLLLRLRRLIAEGILPSKDVALYYVEKEGSESTLKEVPIQANGHIEPDYWPRGFFEDGMKEALDLAVLQAERIG